MDDLKPAATTTEDDRHRWSYGHLRYWAMEWQPCPTMRNTRVSIEKA